MLRIASAPSSGGTGTAGGSLSKVGQGIVIINTTLQYSSERAAGTGMVINAARGLVLTNNHVIENSTKISATVAATGQNFQARVVGYDVTGDIALIQLQHPSGLHQVPLADSGKVKVGDAVTISAPTASGRAASTAAAPGSTARALGDARAHCVAVRIDLRGLAHDRHVEMSDASAAPITRAASSRSPRCMIASAALSSTQGRLKRSPRTS